MLGASAGLVDAERISTDITPYWRPDNREDFAEAPTVPNVCRNVINRRYMHKALWINDPDVHIARLDNNRLSEEEVRLWSSALWLAGGLLLLCDRFESLAPERAELSKLLLRRTDAFRDVRPLDFRDSTVPSVWFGRFAETARRSTDSSISARSRAGSQSGTTARKRHSKSIGAGSCWKPIPAGSKRKCRPTAAGCFSV